jgi:hypothetical protein
VRTAVELVNDLHEAAASQGASAIGDYLLKTFFGDDPAALEAGRRSHVSYRRLARHPDLRVSGAYLNTAVRVAAQRRVLPGDLRERLSYTQHKALLGVHDAALKEQLARRALSEAWPGERLREEASATARAALPSRGGRPPSPPLLKAARRTARSAAALRALAADAPKLPASLRATLARELWQIAADASMLAARIVPTVEPPPLGPAKRSFGGPDAVEPSHAH